MDYLFANRLVLRRGGGVDVARVLEPSVNVVGVAEFADRIDAVGDRATGTNSRFLAVKRDQAVKLVPPTAGEAAVAPARPAAADVLLEHDHLQVGLGLGQVVSGPQAGEAAADDDNVCVDVACQGRAGSRRPLGRQCLAQPPAALGARRQGLAEVQRVELCD